jgi:hypothetical protein
MILRRWCCPVAFLLLAMVAVPACEYGQDGGRNGGDRSAYRMSVTAPPEPVAGALA